MIQTTPAAAGPATRSSRDPELRVPGTPPIIQVRNLEKTYDTARGPLTLFQRSRLRIVEPANWSQLWASRGRERALFCTFWARLMRPPRELYTAPLPTWQSSIPREAAAFRNREIGYVWQFHYLLPEFSALENVAMPLLARGVSPKRGACVAANWLKRGRPGRTQRSSARRALRGRAAARGAGAGPG